MSADPETTAVYPFPLTIRPAFTAGASEVVWTRDEMTAAILRGVDASPVSEVLVTKGNVKKNGESESNASAGRQNAR